MAGIVAAGYASLLRLLGTIWLVGLLKFHFRRLSDFLLFRFCFCFKPHVVRKGYSFVLVLLRLVGCWNENRKNVVNPESTTSTLQAHTGNKSIIVIGISKQEKLVKATLDCDFSSSFSL